MRWRGLFLAGFAIAIFACGGKIEQGEPAPAPDRCAAITGDACSLVTQAQVNAALSSDLPAGQATASQCRLEKPDSASAPAVFISYSCAPLDRSTTLQLADATEVTGIGDFAVWIISNEKNVGSLLVQYGNVSFEIWIDWPAVGEADITKVRAIAQDIIANL